ncbi:MAG: hypothetical protein ACE15C_07200, partial [Phycisphaerae bacterium]
TRYTAFGDPGQPFTLKPGERLALWVDVAVPRTAAAGEYASTLTFTSDTHATWTLPIALEVYGFMLPDARPIAAIGGFDHKTLFRTFITREGKPFEPVRLDRTEPLVRQGLTVLRQMMVMGHEHRLDLFERTIRPALRRDMSGRANLDWDDYDNVVTPYLSGSAFDDRIGCRAWPAPFSEDWPSPEVYGGVGSETYASLAAEVMAECRRHWRAINSTDQMFLWPYRGQVSAEAFGRHAALAGIARAVDSETPILSQLPVKPPPLTLWKPPADFAKSVDILAPPAQWLDPSMAAGMARIDSPLRGVWLCPSQPPYLPGLSVTASPADIRAIPWFAAKYGCTGLFLTDVLNWEGDLYQSPAGAETRLFYPGTAVGIEGVLPSIRLKRLRRGLQDIAYLWVLRQRQQEAIARSITNSLVRYAGLDAAGDNYLDPRLDGWVKDPAIWETARRLLAEEVQAAVHPEEPDNSKLLAQRLKWKEFDEKTHEISIEQVRTFVRPATAGKDRLEATVLVDLFNQYSRDADALIQLEGLPEGWKATAGEAKISPFPAGSRKTVALKAEGAYVSTGANGKMPMRFAITTDMTQRREVASAMPFLVAGRASRPPVIDGALEDWPIRANNSAGDFKAIGLRGQKGDSLASRRTLVFVMYDDKNLYLAFRCEDPNAAALVSRPTNVIHYEQLMACGEDLVEVILDPGGKAKGPEDLYHIVLKASGVILTERGIRSDPPLGKVALWPVAASVAVKPSDKMWVVELAIPLSAFGADGSATFWGVNFTRFCTQVGEASSWSGAPRYFYDPRNLGTMFIVPSEKSARGGSPAGAATAGPSQD